VPQVGAREGNMDTGSSKKMIEGVLVKSLKTHPDSRGFFREVIRTTDAVFEGGPFGQWSHSRMARDVVKAWHYHHIQTDWWYCPIGKIETVLYDNRAESPTFGTKLVLLMGDSSEFPDAREVCVRIPPGVLHGCKVLSNQAHLFYITSVTYDPADEGRIPFNSPVVAHDWGKNALTVENDRREFVPAKQRTLLT